MYMVKMPNGKYDVVLPGIGHNPEINDPAHWAVVIRDGNVSGLYESPYMAALMDSRFVWVDGPGDDAAVVSVEAMAIGRIVDLMREEIVAFKGVIAEMNIAVSAPKTFTGKVG